MTVSEAIRDAAAELGEISDTARLDAELLMAHALGVPRSDMLVRLMDEPAPSEFFSLIGRRSKHEPVAYITGIQEFYGREFAVSPDVLIPRPDSEILIETVLEWASDKKSLSVLDLGTGSGALLLTLLAELPRSIGTGIEASAAAAKVARYNARVFDADGLLPRGIISKEIGRCRILQRNWREGGWTRRLNKFDLIVCNPPYVEADALLDPDVREYEPVSALFAGADGLDDYRILIPQIRDLMRDGGVAVFEIGHTQADAVTNLAKKEGFSVELRHDLAGRPRILILS